MDETQGKGVECLSRHNLEAVGNKLFVFGEGGAFEYLVASVQGIVEEWMPYMSHMGANLMCASGFEDAFHESDVAETL